MKLDVDVNEVILTNVGQTGEFRIRNSAKAFKILSDGLYSNKIRAIIRELSCNAVDSHVAAGKADVPFEVHLPNTLEPWFSVRDFGLGLDDKQVMNIYTTYFESTKTDSNDFIGALGLGSKSPFSYTENFTVIAIKDGKKRIYSAFINEKGVPSVAEMSTEDTDECNGVEVKFSVTKRYDYDSFRHEASNVFKWFTLKPIVKGSDYYVNLSPAFKEKDIVPGVHVLAHGEGTSIALMGNIAYPLRVPEAQKHFGSLASLLECSLLLDFDIGELDFAASREELSYVPLTLDSIKKKLEALNANLATHLATKANAIPNLWNRAIYLSEQFHTSLYRAAVQKYVKDTKFPLFDPSNYYGRKTFMFPEQELKAKNLDIKAFRSAHGSATRYGLSSDYINHQYVEVQRIPIENHAVFVLNDLKTGCYSRTRFHFTKIEKSEAMVYCLDYIGKPASSSKEDIEKFEELREKAYKDFLEELHGPAKVIKASSLEKPVRAKAMSSQGIMRLGVRPDHRKGRIEAYSWYPYQETLDPKKKYYYVFLNNYVPKDASGNDFDASYLRVMMDECGVDDISNIEIFGVRKNRSEEIQSLKNWIWIEDKLKEEVAKISDKHVASLVAAEVLDGYNNRTYTNARVAAAVGPDSYYHKYVTEVAGIKRANGNVTYLAGLCTKYGKSVQAEAVKKKLTDNRNKLLETYPMLKHIVNSPNEADVIEYIKMVDKQQEKN